MVTTGLGKLAVLILLSLSPYGPAKIQPGDWWSYRVDDSNLVLRITEVVSEESGTRLEGEVGAGGQVVPVSMTLSPDRLQMTLRAGAAGEREASSLTMSGLDVGAVWSLLTGNEAKVVAVETMPVFIGQREYDRATKVTVQAVGEEAVGGGELWFASGVGLLALDADGKRQVELLGYRLAKAVGEPAPSEPVMPARLAPGIAVLDQNTFVLADPETRTVTVFRLVRSDAKGWRLERMATASYDQTPSPAR